ncbi:hypothetical protein THAOC_30583, partial [Thalassiosira oceanica]
PEATDSGAVVDSTRSACPASPAFLSSSSLELNEDDRDLNDENDSIRFVMLGVRLELELVLRLPLSTLFSPEAAAGCTSDGSISVSETNDGNEPDESSRSMAQARPRLKKLAD